MTDYRDWFKSQTGGRITAEELANILDISRATVTRRLTEGLDAGDIITISRKLNVNPVEALVDLGHITHTEALDFVDGDGMRVEGADPGILALELARQLNPATMAPELDELAARRQDTHDGTVVDWDDTQPHAADGSQEEDGSPDDYIP